MICFLIIFPPRPRKKIGFIRYITFAVSLLFVGALFVLHVPGIEQIMFLSFMIGNALYYALGIALAFALRDNRAFCKYICPVTVFLKPASYFLSCGSGMIGKNVFPAENAKEPVLWM